MSLLWITLLPWDKITASAREHKIDKYLLASIVSVESGGRSDSNRYEDHYRWLYKPEKFSKSLKITTETETVMQKTSWGLGQVMGGVARELGHKGNLVELCNPDVGLHFAALKISNLLKRFPDTEDAVSSYNQGSPRRELGGDYNNQGYVDKVMGRLQALKEVFN